MATTYKIIGQANVTSAGSYTTIYTTPSSASAVISTIAVANTGGSLSSYSVAIVPSTYTSSTPEIKHYILYDASITAFASHFITVGVSLGASDKLVVTSSATDVSFNVSGSEIS